MEIIGLFQNWLAAEPAAGLWLIVSAVLFVLVPLSHPQTVGSTYGGMVFRLLMTLFEAALLIAIPLGVRFLLLNNSAVFDKFYGSYTSHNSQSYQTWNQWRRIYGSGFTQSDLQVVQYIQSEKVSELTPLPNAQQPRYINVKEEQKIDQNSITSFTGVVHITHADGAQQPDSFHGFQASAIYDYQVTNPTDQKTRATYRFPLSNLSNLYKQIQITQDGQPFDQWQVLNDNIAWENNLEPHQNRLISISYSTLAMENYYFQITNPQLITQFSFKIDTGDMDCCYYSSPDSNAIHNMAGIEGGNHFSTWTIDRAVITPKMGFYIPQGWPYNPTQNISTYGLTLPGPCCYLLPWLF